MTDEKLRKLVKCLPELGPETLAAALDTVRPVEPGMSPATLANLIRSIVRSWEKVLEMGRLP